MSRISGFLKLPHSLLVFFRSPHIEKVGVHIKADLTRLFRDCGFGNSDEPFSGALELGMLAKQCKFTDCANISLADLSAVVLKCYLSKEPHIRVSTAWDNATLTHKQETYAALDVYTGATFLEAFDDIPIGSPVSMSTPGGTCVRLMSRDQTSTVAYGTVALQHPTTFGGVNVTPT